VRFLEERIYATAFGIHKHETGPLLKTLGYFNNCTRAGFISACGNENVGPLRNESFGYCSSNACRCACY
jgi:hypothetical protein